jgi:hypothetical protein
MKEHTTQKKPGVTANVHRHEWVKGGLVRREEGRVTNEVKAAQTFTHERVADPEPNTMLSSLIA